ncbi:hypothetical protein C0993_002005, partial [Termitomyces sp. T159_Od127]
YKVKWKDYEIEDISWEPQENVHALGLVREFHWRHPDAPQAIWGIYPISSADQAIRNFFYPARRDATR